jgi:hypothetical protein
VPKQAVGVGNNKQSFPAVPRSKLLRRDNLNFALITNHSESAKDCSKASIDNSQGLLNNDKLGMALGNDA